MVLAYTPGGFGNSTGLIGLNSPAHEIADGRQRGFVGTPAAATPATSAFADGGVLKRSWAGILFGDGLSASASACGRFVPEVCQAYQQIATTGRATASTVDLLRRDSPVSVTSHITVPTLLVQAEQDTLFGLDQADVNARQITEAGGRVRYSCAAENEGVKK